MTRSCVLLVCLCCGAAVVAADEKDDLALSLTKTLDYRQHNGGDYKALVYLEQKQKGKDDLIYDLVVYRRDVDEKLVMLFLKPKAEAGKGYLRLDKNLFLYDPTTGKWERRTERERIGGTSSNRKDFDESRLTEDYTSVYIEQTKLGAFTVHHIKLTARPNADVAYPLVQLWIDAATSNLLKEQDFALSGRLMRTTYYPKWEKMFSKDKGADVYFPREIRVFDEVEEGTSAVIVIREVTLEKLDANIFTKAWLESKSR
jgi:hypothetical protein